jgi:hypothetical protein
MELGERCAVLITGAAFKFVGPDKRIKTDLLAFLKIAYATAAA